MAIRFYYYTKKLKTIIMEIKIAFCFLTYNKIVRFDIWNEFFKNIDNNKYIVYIHPKNQYRIENYTFPYTIVKNRVYTTSKDNISIVKATLRLLREAYSPENTHYIFLSQSCIPIYSFNFLYNFLSNIKNSIISCILKNKMERYNDISIYLKKYISYEHFFKQQPNMILIREDVELLLKNDYTDHFKNMQCPDEHYFINILLNLYNKKILKNQTHFCNYHLNRTQALEYKNIDEKFIKMIRNYGFLFMRKVIESSLIDINYILNL